MFIYEIIIILGAGNDSQEISNDVHCLALDPSWLLVPWPRLSHRQNIIGAELELFQKKLPSQFLVEARPCIFMYCKRFPVFVYFDHVWVFSVAHLLAKFLLTEGPPFFRHCRFPKRRRTPYSHLEAWFWNCARNSNSLFVLEWLLPNLKPPLEVARYMIFLMRSRMFINFNCI